MKVNGKTAFGFQRAARSFKCGGLWLYVVGFDRSLIQGRIIHSEGKITEESSMNSIKPWSNRIIVLDKPVPPKSGNYTVL